ncbi:hypothetical protein L1987_79219 [Smallanthus sonchifolius]|uniref:Uncharacterized protein n=1 Tax=Smallanthus sonchifolius TaxID=185202 RepID=A0ACB8ZE32_9ASTR|nr:hypothetical protein L1987_79219 [Smallanthus sonchifolius]
MEWLIQEVNLQCYLPTIYNFLWFHRSLPPSVIYVLTLSSKGEGQMDFLIKRQPAWKTSFHSLYFMLRKNICNLFNVYNLHRTKLKITHKKEQDISFSMPLCHSKVEQVTTEDLFELS